VYYEGIDDIYRKAGRGEGRKARRGRLEDRDTFIGDSLFPWREGERSPAYEGMSAEKQP
jgi:hypothetical protein